MGTNGEGEGLGRENGRDTAGQFYWYWGLTGAGDHLQKNSDQMHRKTRYYWEPSQRGLASCS